LGLFKAKVCRQACSISWFSLVLPPPQMKQGKGHDDTHSAVLLAYLEGVPKPALRQVIMSIQLQECHACRWMRVNECDRGLPNRIGIRKLDQP